MTNEERAREAVEKVLIDLSDRSGMNLLDQIRWDDPELWKEIIGDGSSIILAALNAATAPLVAERDRLREALKPFADEAERYEPDEGDDRHVAWSSPFSIGALRRARSALAEKEPG